MPTATPIAITTSTEKTIATVVGTATTTSSHAEKQALRPLSYSRVNRDRRNASSENFYTFLLTDDAAGDGTLLLTKYFLGYPFRKVVGLVEMAQMTRQRTNT